MKNPLIHLITNYVTVNDVVNSKTKALAYLKGLLTQ